MTILTGTVYKSLIHTVRYNADKTRAINQAAKPKTRLCLSPFGFGMSFAERLFGAVSRHLPEGFNSGITAAYFKGKISPLQVNGVH